MPAFHRTPLLMAVFPGNLFSHCHCLLADRDIPEDHYDTCAVVGNGGVMLAKEWGHGIDLHDAVFRFNDGPTVGTSQPANSEAWRAGWRPAVQRLWWCEEFGVALCRVALRSMWDQRRRTSLSTTSGASFMERSIRREPLRRTLFCLATGQLGRRYGAVVCMPPNAPIPSVLVEGPTIAVQLSVLEAVMWKCTGCTA